MIEARLASIHTPAQPKAPVPASAADGAALSIFDLSKGPNAAKDVSATLLGVSVMPGRRAALLAIDGKLAQWLAVGESSHGVTLQDVTSNRASIDTALGAKEIALGAATAQSHPPADAGSEPIGAPPLGVPAMPAAPDGPGPTQ